MLLVLSVDEVKAQTSTPTPGFSTVPPGATPTPAGSSPVNSVTFDFRIGEAGFTSLFGSQVIALGFQTNNEIMDLKGGYAMIDVSSVVLHYNSDAAFEVGFELCETDCLGDDPIVHFQYGLVLPACPSGCEYVYSIDHETIGKIKFAFQAVDVGEPYDGVFVVSAIDVTFERGVFDYETEGDCPILSPEQIDELDPLYRASCSRCFTTPTPERDLNPFGGTLTVAPTLDGTLQSTFQIPVIISGTPMTATPIVVAPGGGSTATFTPTATFVPETDLQRWITFDDTIAYITNGNGGSRGGAGNPSPGHDSSIWVASAGGDTYDMRSVSITVYIADIVDFNGYSFEYTVDRTSSEGVVGIHVYGFTGYTGHTIEIDGNLSGGTEILDSAASGIENSWTRNHSQSITPTNDYDSLVITAYIGNRIDLGDPSDLIDLRIDNVKIFGGAALTPTPVLTSTPHSTGVPWLGTPDLSDNDCSVITLRDDTPVAEFPTNFTVVDYGCYTIVPEVDITIAEPDINIHGLSLCITWFQMPVISILGIVATLDWLLIALSVWLIAIIMKV